MQPRLRGPEWSPHDADSTDEPGSWTGEGAYKHGVRDPRAPDERRRIALTAFAQAFASLDHLLPEWWGGIWDRLRTIAPVAALSVEVAEVQANRVALAFVAGRAGEDDFYAAIEGFANEWRDAAEILRYDLGALRWEPCNSCGRTDMVVAIRDHDGIVRCGSCWGEFLRR